MVAKQAKKAWVVAVDMGYGHLRAAHALYKIAEGGETISADAYPGIPREDEAVWRSTRRLYDFISRFKRVPLVGEAVFSVFDSFQSISSFYPKVRRSRPTLQLRQIFKFLEQRSWGRHFISQLQSPIPFVSTFFVPAFMAERWRYEGSVYLVVTDTDVSRVWAPLHPQRTKIRYCAPTERAAERLSLYGIPERRIHVTGFPLPDIFSTKDLARRVTCLDPERRYRSAFAPLVAKHLREKLQARGPISLTFAVGGAGAQKELGRDILLAFVKDLKKGKLRLNLVAGIHEDVRSFFELAAREAGVSRYVKILYAKTKDAYFQRFNNLMKGTDVLWTKPSELVFFSALGIPLLLAPSIGSQEKANRRWVLEKGFGVEQPDTGILREWFWDVVASGQFAEAAMEGYLEGERKGAENIAKLVLGK
ncbi:MAG: hypothetical protein Q8Q38_02540 [bacterium]|nr:hypothetical protein [bacterium]